MKEDNLWVKWDASDKDMWDHHNTPNHSFISWLAMRQILQTKSRLHHLGVCATDQCLLCGREEEDHEHLFFRCSICKQCLQAMKRWLGVQTTSNTLAQFLTWTNTRCIGSKFKHEADH